MSLRIHYFILAALFIALSFSVLSNIQYPLLWNDEAETAMFATRILKYGYPKISDGKNIVYQLKHPDKTLGIKSSNNAYIGTTWGHFYFGTIGVFLAQFTSNLYLKTALIRLPFALIGLFGVIIFPLPFLRLFKKHNHRLLFLNLYLLLQLLSLPLALHLREARYYSLIIFIYALITNLYFHIPQNKKPNIKPYILSSIFSILLFLSFHTYYPTYFILVITFLIHTIYHLHHQQKLHIKTLFTSPVILYFLFSLPFVFVSLLYFDTFHISSAMSAVYDSSLQQYFGNLQYIFAFLIKYDLLLIAFGLKAYINFTKSPSTKDSPYRDCPFSVQSFITIFFLVHILVITCTPFMFERYIVLIQPLITLSILLDVFFILQHHKPHASMLKLSSISLLFLTLTRTPLYSDHIYELFHPYRGPIDYAVAYIQKYFPKPQNLIIATNYEEQSLMYYLDSQVLIGYVGNDLKNSLTLTPDILIERRDTGGDHDPTPFHHYRSQAKYTPIILPVLDYSTNNIPSLYYPRPHLFRTRLPNDPSRQLLIEVRQDLYQQHINP